MMNSHTLIATWFGSGLLKPGPGTWGSAATAPLFVIAHVIGLTPLVAIIVSLALLVIGTIATNRYMAEHNKHDPKEVVIDEVLGQWMVWSALSFIHCSFACSTKDLVAILIIGFIVFRAFDIFKPWPISWCDKHVKGGFGVMFDDVLAALFAIGITWLAYIQFN